MNTFNVSTRLSISKCCECGRKLDGVSGARKPHPGDLTLCIYCGSANAFANDLTLRYPTDEEMLYIAADSDFQLLRQIILEAKDVHKKSTEIG